MAKVLKRIASEVEQQYGIRPHVRDLKPMDGVEFVYCLNLTRCIGCRKCVHACVAENNQSRNPEIQYIRVLKMPHGSLDMEKGDHNYAPESVPEKGFFYMPVQCQQCKNPPCVKVCPVNATWQETDGITVIDYDWCIGCRYCEAACPYLARRFNLTKPSDPEGSAESEHVLSGQPPAQARRDGEMPFLHSTHARGQISGVPGSLPGRRAEIRQHPRSRKRGLLHPADQTGLHPAQGRTGDFAAVLLLLRRMIRGIRNYLSFSGAAGASPSWATGAITPGWAC